MRGRTLSDAFVIIDEAQNTTTEQMKMVLTRIGLGSKVVVTGDITQIDLPAGKISGLVEAISVLSGTEGIAFCYFDEKDVVRHRLVQSIVKAYERWTERPGQGALTMSAPALAGRRAAEPPAAAPRERAAPAARAARGRAQRCACAGELSLVLAGDGLLRRLNRELPRQGQADRRALVPGRRRARPGSATS